MTAEPLPVSNFEHRSRGATNRRSRRPRSFWLRAAPVLARHVAYTMPWATLIAGCACGTVALAVLVHVAGPSHSPIDQNTVRIAFLPAIAALAFVCRVPFRPLIQTTPVPAWIASAGHTLMALPLLAATGWVQLRIMAGSVPPGFVERLPALYPLLAQFVGWSALTIAVAACCERSRYGPLSGTVGAPVSLAAIAFAWLGPGVKRFLAIPPATPHAATAGWYIVSVAAVALTGVALRDQWQRYTRLLHRPPLARAVSRHEQGSERPSRRRSGHEGWQRG